MLKMSFLVASWGHLVSKALQAVRALQSLEGTFVASGASKTLRRRAKTLKAAPGASQVTPGHPWSEPRGSRAPLERSQGLPGSPGALIVAARPTGLTGLPGLPGLTRVTGLTKLTGLTGRPRLTGLTGLDGLTGRTFSPGSPGSPGSPSSTGSSGLTGLTGKRRRTQAHNKFEQT